MNDFTELFDISVDDSKRYTQHRGFKSILRRKDKVNGYDYYTNGLVSRHISGYLRGNEHVTQILEYIDKILIRLLDKVKYIRNINNFYIDPDDTSIN